MRDNFFEIGGHCLLAMRVMSRVTHAFNVDLPLRAFFENLTIAQLAESVEEARARGEEQPDPSDRTDFTRISHSNLASWRKNRSNGSKEGVAQGNTGSRCGWRQASRRPVGKEYTCRKVTITE